LKYLLLLLLFVSSISWAECSVDDELCAPVGEWQLSVAIGGGVISNPLHDGKNIPLVVIPYIHYYGERFFIENNTLGYTFYENQQVSLSFIGQLNREKAYFTRWKPSHLFLPNFSETSLAPSDERTVTAEQVKKRKWAFDAGIQVNWFVNKNTMIEGQFLHDISRAYQGEHASLAINQRIKLPKQFANTRLTVAAGVNWHSKKLTNYYYGLDADDDIDPAAFYTAGSGINPFIRATLTYSINERWTVKLNLKREFISSEVTSSPLVEDKTLDVAYLGMVYAF